MLELTRRQNESIWLQTSTGEQIEIRTLATNDRFANIGISAPESIEIYRNELWQQITADRYALADKLSIFEIKCEITINVGKQMGISTISTPIAATCEKDALEHFAHLAGPGHNEQPYCSSTIWEPLMQTFVDEDCKASAAVWSALRHQCRLGKIPPFAIEIPDLEEAA